jgi:hypothetical protein
MIPISVVIGEIAKLGRLKQGEDTEFWFGPEDEKYPVEEFEAKMGRTVDQELEIWRGLYAKRLSGC